MAGYNECTITLVSENLITGAIQQVIENSADCTYRHKNLAKYLATPEGGLKSIAG